MKMVSLALLALFLFGPAGPSHAGDWRSKYTTGRKEFEACCGHKDCHTAASLGFPEMRRDGEGGYYVHVQGHWIKYDFPAVHESEDKNIWICFLESNAEPDPLCLFFPPGVS